MDTNNYELQTLDTTPRGLILDSKGAPLLTEQTYALAERTYAAAELSAMRSKLRGALASQAMNNVAMLAAAEAHFSQIAPGGREEYRLITRAYAYTVARELMGGEW